MTADRQRMRITLRHNRSGAEVTFERDMALDPDTGEVSMWIYREGNWSCDCNRILDWGAHVDPSLPEVDIDGGEENVCVGGDNGSGQFSALVCDLSGAVHYADGQFVDGPSRVPGLVAGIDGWSLRDNRPAWGTMVVLARWP